jgi:type IV pilus assembly protein PilC
MPRFAYTAIEPGSGRECHGAVAGTSREQAAAELKARGLAPTSLALLAEIPRETASGVPSPPGASRRPDLGRTLFPSRPALSRRRLTLFTRQLATLVKAGIPLVRALEVLARPERNPAVKAVIAGLAEAIRAGGNFSDGLQQYPGTFDPLYVNMVRAGEAGGVLDTVLDRLARFMEKAERLRARVKAALTYPVIILVVAGGIVAGLLAFVVPKFEQVFSGLLKGRPLPPLTRGVMGAGDFMSHHFLAAAGLALVLWFGLGMFRRTRPGTRLMDWLLLKSPLVGDLLLKAAIARFTRTFGALLASGVPMLDALVITRDTSGNVHVAAALKSVHDRVKGGETVARPMEATALFPGLVTSMIEIGEETGALSDMLGRIADAYDEEVDNAVSVLTAFIEPVLIVIMAAVVGVVVIALFLPIVTIIQHLQ